MLIDIDDLEDRQDKTNRLRFPFLNFPSLLATAITLSYYGSYAEVKCLMKLLSKKCHTYIVNNRMSGFISVEGDCMLDYALNRTFQRKLTWKINFYRKYTYGN